MKRLIASAFYALQCATASTYGAVVLDQFNIVPPYGSVGAGAAANDIHIVAQVVTAGISGKLARIDLGIYQVTPGPGPIYVDIAKTIGQIPDFTESGRLATRAIDLSVLPPYTYQPAFTLSVDFSADNLQFATGERYAITLRYDGISPRTQQWYINADSVSTYTGGSLYDRNLLANTTRDFGADAQFRTFVEIVPEPSTFVLSGSTLVAISLIRRRRPL